jgi:magnesium transporter
VVSISMVLIVVVGSLIGMCLPFLLSKLRFDPATASAPLVTSIADAVGVILYLSIAVLVLGEPQPA